MVDMTILHIASPFAVSAPVSESAGSAAAHDGQRDRQREPAPVQAMADGQRLGAVQDSGQIDPRDTRLTASRTVDLSSQTADRAAAGSLDAVLEAYRQDLPPAGVGGDPIDDGDAGPPASIDL